MQNSLGARLLLSTAILALSSSTWAFDIHNVDLSIASGATAPINTSSAGTVSSSTEWDTYTPLTTSFSLNYQMGVGYHLFNDQLKNQLFFNDLVIRLSLSHNTSTTIDGQAFKQSLSWYGASYSDWMDFQSSYSTTTLMLEMRPSLFTVMNLSPYLVIGAGEAWTDMDLTDTPTSSWNSLNYARNYSSYMNKNVAYEFGFGVKTSFEHNFNINGEFIYTDIGKIHPQRIDGFNDAPAFSVGSVSFMLGAIWTL